MTLVCRGAVPVLVALVLAFVYFQVSFDAHVNRRVLQSTLWTVFFILTIIGGVAAWLFVLAHPLVARPDQKGQFTLLEVPEGEYDLVCWLPDWREASREWDGDTARLWRVTYRPAREQVRRVRVQAKGVCQASFEWSVEP